MRVVKLGGASLARFVAQPGERQQRALRRTRQAQLADHHVEYVEVRALHAAHDVLNCAIILMADHAQIDDDS